MANPDTDVRKWLNRTHCNGSELDIAISEGEDLRDTFDSKGVRGRARRVLENELAYLRGLRASGHERTRLHEETNGSGPKSVDLRWLAERTTDFRSYGQSGETLRRELQPLRPSGVDLKHVEANSWEVVVDESGRGDDHRPNTPEEDSEPMMFAFVAIPPHLSPPALIEGFHSTAMTQQEVSDALTPLLEEEEVVIAVWEYKSGRPPERFDSRASSALHLSFWGALPLVLELIVQKDAEMERGSEDRRHAVHPVFEQVGPLEAGSDALLGSLADFLSGEDARTEWERLDFLEADVVEKDAHPWLGFADAVSYTLRKRPTSQLAHRIRERSNTHILPYRGDAVTRLRKLIAPSSSPRELVDGIIDLKANDIHDYAPLLRGATRKALRALSARDWEYLLPTLDDRLKNAPNTYVAVEFLLRQWQADCDGGSLVPDESISPVSALQFLTANLNAANHAGDFERAESIQFEGLELINNHPQRIDTEVVDWFHIGCAGAEMNRFDFEEATHFVQTRLDANVRRKPFVTSILESICMQCHAFRGELDRALELSAEILEEQRYRKQEDVRRHCIYRAHILCDDGDYERALDMLEEAAAPASLREGAGESRYLAAALMKVWASRDQIARIPDWWHELIWPTTRLVHDHPGRAVAFWGLRLLAAHGDRLETPPVDDGDTDPARWSRALIEHCARPCTPSDADVAGVIRGCQLRHIQRIAGGLTDKLHTVGFDPDNFDIPTYWETVLQNSQPSTRTWVAGFDTDADPLSPLRFNYR